MKIIISCLLALAFFMAGPSLASAQDLKKFEQMMVDQVKDRKTAEETLNDMAKELNMSVESTTKVFIILVDDYNATGKVNAFYEGMMEESGISAQGIHKLIETMISHFR